MRTCVALLLGLFSFWPVSAATPETPSARTESTPGPVQAQGGALVVFTSQTGFASAEISQTPPVIDTLNPQFADTATW